MPETEQKQLTPAEIARVFALYHGTDWVAQQTKDLWDDDEGQGYTHIVKGKTYNSAYQVEQGMGWRFYDSQSYFKLLLTPLSRITDEDAVETVPMKDWEFYRVFKDHGIGVQYRRKYHPEAIKFNEDGYEYTSRYISESNLTVPQHYYLISKGYAVPLWFGVGHWANRQNAITLGIAIDKTE